MAKTMTTARRIARAQKARARRDYEIALLLDAGGGTVANSRFLTSLFEQVKIKKHYLSSKQMAVVMRMIAEREKRHGQTNVHKEAVPEGQPTTQRGQAASPQPQKPEKESSTPTLSTKPKAKVRVERPKRTETRVAPKHTLKELQRIHASRSAIARGLDEVLLHGKVIQPDSPYTPRWIRDPGSMDIRGVDTPGSVPRVKNRKAARPKPPHPKLRSERKGKLYHTQSVGGVMVSRRPPGRKRKQKA